MKTGCKVLFALVVLTLPGSVPAAAEPISLNYRVTVFQRLDLTRTFTDWDPITPVSFDFSVRFDGGISSQRVPDQSDGRYAFTYFGTPDFSNVPLRGAGYSGGTHAAQTYVVNATINGALHQEAVTLNQFSEDSDTSGGARTMELLKMGLNPPLPRDAFGDLDTFLRAMRDPDLAFYFSDLAYTKDSNAGGRITFVPGSASYFGRLTALSPAAVPEPATMTLFGLGLAALITRRAGKRAAG